MAQIPSDGKFIFEESIRSDGAVSESAFQTIGGSINYLLEELPLLAGKTLKVVEFTSNGIFTVPADVQTILVEGCGGGGGGAGGKQWSPLVTRAFLFYQGGFGSTFHSRLLSVAPNSSHNVTIGLGGSGAPSIVGNSSNGLNGGNTTLGSIFTAEGGVGGSAFIAGYSTEGQASNSILSLFPATHLSSRLGNTRGSVNYNAIGLPNGIVLPFIVAQSSLAGFSNSDTYAGGAGAFGAAASGMSANAAANTGAGGNSSYQIANNLPTIAAGNGGSGRLRISYVSQF